MNSKPMQKQRTNTRKKKNVTVGISDELAKKMEEFDEVNWSSICRKCIEKYIENRRSYER